MIYVFITTEPVSLTRRVTVTGAREGLPPRDLRLPHQLAPLRLRPASARAPAGDGTIQERHGRPGQDRPPQLQGPRHREQNGQSVSQAALFLLISLYLRKYQDLLSIILSC